MKQNQDNISPQALEKLAQSDVGRELMAMLRNTEAANAVQRGAQSGNMDDAKKAVSAFLSDPKARALLQQLEAQYHE